VAKNKIPVMPFPELFFPFLQNFFTSAMCLSAGQKKIFKA
jgi:hypothetical protein